ncbi:MAG: BTAD domain-containing putative transcriptional regulator [Acidimicrobiales bacterium]
MSEAGESAPSNPGSQVLAWMHEQFVALQARLDEMAEQSDRQGDAVRELAESTSAELSVSLAQMEGYAAELRNETARLGGFQDELAAGLPSLIADAVTTHVRASVTDPLPGLVGEAVRPELRDALGELRRSVAALRAESAELAAWRSELTAVLPQLVADIVRGGAPVSVDRLARPTPPTRPTPVEAPPPRPAAGEVSAMTSGPTLAAAIAEALGLARLRVRRRRRAGVPGAGLRRQDPLLGAAVRQLSLIAGSPHPGSVAELPIGERDHGELTVRLDELPGITIIGPRSSDVARALVLTFLARNPPESGHVVMAGALFPASPPLPGLDRVADLGSALDLLAEELDRRESSKGQTLEEGPYPGSAILLAASVPASAELPRLRWILDRGRALGIFGVLVGRAADLPAHVEVDSDGSVVACEPSELAARLVGSQLFTLPPEAAGELLAVLSAARSDSDHFRRARFGDSTFPVAEEPRSGGPVTGRARVLGPFGLDLMGTDVTADMDAKAIELVAFLAMNPEGATVDAIGKALWPGARHHFAALLDEVVDELAVLLRSVDEDLAPSDLVVRSGNRLFLESTVDVDLWRLQRTLARAAAQSVTSDRAEGFGKAAAIYRGELFEGHDWLWGRAPRDDLRQRMVDVLVWTADSLWAGGDTDGAARALDRAIEVDPFSEQLYRRQMRLCARRSRPDEVEQSFERLETRLREIGLEPTPESEKLFLELVGD